VTAGVSPELQLIVTPRDTYARLARSRSRGGALIALRRPALLAVVIGAAIALGATGHVTPRLLLSTTLCWTLLVVLQVAIAVALIAGPARRTVGLSRALDLFFASHAPWSVWLFAAAAWSPSVIGRPLMPLLISAVLPLALTVRIIAAYFREVLELDPRHARLRTIVQQAATWGIPLVLYGAAVAIWPRFLEMIR
jgi:hypothetical protein